MRVSRSAAAICALVMLVLPSAAPALTAFDAGAMPSEPTPRMLAVEARSSRPSQPADPSRSSSSMACAAFTRRATSTWLGSRSGEPTPQMRALRAADGRTPQATASTRPPTPRQNSPRCISTIRGCWPTADVEFSRAVARFVTHLASGRIRPRDISSIITLEPERPDVAGALALLAGGGDAASALARFEPTHPQYRALKQALADLRARADDDFRSSSRRATCSSPAATIAARTAAADATRHRARGARRAGALRCGSRRGRRGVPGRKRAHRRRRLSVRARSSR